MKNGEDIAKVAKSKNLEVTTSSTFGRADSIDGLGPANAIEGIFDVKAGGVLGPLPVAGRSIVAKVVEKTDADMAALPVEHDTILGQLKQKKIQERNAILMDGILEKLTNEGKVKMNQKEIQNMVASLRQK
jgi:hypothetical protein